MLAERGVFLVDTSIWIAVFQKRRPLRLETFVALDEVIVCLPVVQEVLQGFREEAAYRLAHEAMLAMTIVESPLRQEVFEEAAQIYRSGRRSGLTIRSGVDCLIAACAMRHTLTVLHQDRDFDEIARVAPLKVRRIPS